MSETTLVKQLPRPVMQVGGIRILHCMKCGEARAGNVKKLALVSREGESENLCVLCDKCIGLYPFVGGYSCGAADLMDILDAVRADRMDWRIADTEPMDSLDFGRAVDLERLDPERIFWPEFGYRLMRTGDLACSLCGAGSRTREMYWLLSDDDEAMCACLACMGFYPPSLLSGDVVESVRWLACYQFDYADLESMLTDAPDVLAVTLDDWPSKYVFEDRLSWSEREDTKVLVSEDVRRLVYENIAETEMRLYSTSAGAPVCTRCWQVLKDGQFSLTAFGNGLFCTDVDACVRRTVMDLEDPDGSRIVICESCRCNLRGREYRFDRENRMLVCSDSVECRRRLDRGRRPTLDEAYGIKGWPTQPD